MFNEFPADGVNDNPLLVHVTTGRSTISCGDGVGLFHVILDVIVLPVVVVIPAFGAFIIIPVEFASTPL
ncbi:hypothetical protein D3C86_2219410 [compost metagenome]